MRLYRAAALAWRKAWREAAARHEDIRLANPHLPNHAAALAVMTLAPEMRCEEAWRLEHRVDSPAAQAHSAWMRR
ncbi:MAG: hypothetical protein WAN43_05135 [Rhodomicrobium sp.]